VIAKKPIVVDFFCGCGGFSLGASRAGFSIIGAIDNDPRVISAHEKNFPNAKHLNVDLATATGEDIRELLGLGESDIDGIIGGPPCQGFSNIGQRNDLDPRNKLFFHFFRLVTELRPNFFLCENVPGILRPEYNLLRETALSQVSGLYNILSPMKLAANDFGAPTSRQRVFFFGYKRELHLFIDKNQFLPGKEISKIRVKDALIGLPRKISSQWQSEEQGWRKVGISHDGEFGKRLNSTIPTGVGDPEAIRRLKEEKRVSGCLGTHHTEAVIERFKEVETGHIDIISKCSRLDPEGYCPTLRAGTGSEHGSYQSIRPLHPTENRVITPREAARLQGFPDWYQFDSTKWHSFRQIGNSVSPILAEHLLKVVRGVLNIYFLRSRND
jgi:DNA (cytosine-5)-methyltransferase 1